MIAASIFVHVLGKMMGPQHAAAILNTMITRGPGSERFPAPECVRTVHGLERVAGPVKVYADCSERDEGLARSRALHWAHDYMTQQPECSAWVTCDDDVTASDATLLAAVKYATAVTHPRIVVVPCAIPGSAHESAILSAAGGAQTIASEANVQFLPASGRGLLLNPEPAKDLQPIVSAGLGLAVFNRGAVERVKWRCGEMAYTDHDGVSRLAAFLPYLRGDDWLSPAEALFARLSADVERLALCVGETQCSGVKLDLTGLK